MPMTDPRVDARIDAAADFAKRRLTRLHAVAHRICADPAPTMQTAGAGHGTQLELPHR